jgi:ornithine cyclodeaminase/alanine dehydrogenase-like protein (mu-crystallin family)
MILNLSEADIAKVLRYEELIPVVEKALSAFSAGQVIQPVRNMLTIEEAKRFLGIMPAVTEEGMGAKLVCFFPKNADSNLPTHLAMIMLFRPDTGQPLAFMDGRLITEMRTAAVSAAVTRHLASPESRILALLASGVQARAHLQALRHVCQFDEVRVWSRTPDHAKRFAELHSAKAMDLEPAVRGADVIVTATNSLEPFLKGAWLKEGAHVNAVGSPRPT